MIEPRVLDTPPSRRPDAVARALQPGRAPRAGDRMAAPRRGHRRDPQAEARAERGHPGAQLSDPRHLPHRRRHHRRLSRAGARGGAHRRRGHRAGRGAFHGRDGEAVEPGEDRADPRSRGRLLARRLDHRGGCPPDAGAPSRRADRHLCQHLGRGEGGKRHLLHLGQRQEDHRGVGRAQGHHAARRIPRAQHRGPDQGRDHRLEGPLRGARALHAGGYPQPAREPSRHHRAGASRMPARGRRRMRLRRLDRGDGRLCRAEAAGARRAADRMLDERQCRAAIPRARFRPAVQSVPAYEADHARQHPPRARNHDP